MLILYQILYITNSNFWCLQFTITTICLGTILAANWDWQFIENMCSIEMKMNTESIKFNEITVHLHLAFKLNIYKNCILYSSDFQTGRR